MADYCVFCDTRRPEGGTNHLVLNGGQMWLEFCTRCGDREWLYNPLTEERFTVYNLFAQGTGLPHREPTQTFEEWNGENQRSAGFKSSRDRSKRPEPSRPTLADVWPSS